MAVTLFIVACYGEPAPVTFDHSSDVPIQGDTLVDEDDCNEPFEVYDAVGEVHEVGSYLKFALNEDSPKGPILPGMRSVLVVDATAKCGDVMLEEVLFQALDDGDDHEWMTEVALGYSGVAYDDNGTPVFHSYDGSYDGIPRVTSTALYWEHQFEQRIVIQEGEVFSFALNVLFGDTVTPPGKFSFSLNSRSAWFGLDDPESYPVELFGDEVQGNELYYIP
jgi:hypothetical protein